MQRNGREIGAPVVSVGSDVPPPPSSAEKQILKIVEEIRDLLVRQRPEKDKYTVPEAAKILGKKPFTVREWCRLGRVKAEKAACGRSSEGEWLISREEIVRVQNEGLEPEHTHKNR